MVWCELHRRYERGDDFIDFPCSQDWLDFYCESGLTPRHSSSFNRDPRLDVLEQSLATLSCKLDELEREFDNLRRRAVKELGVKQIADEQRKLRLDLGETQRLIGQQMRRQRQQASSETKKVSGKHGVKI
jgi:hypothetical protein